MFYMSHELSQNIKDHLRSKKAPFMLKHSDLNKTVDLRSYGQLLPLFFVQNTWA